MEVAPLMEIAMIPAAPGRIIPTLERWEIAPGRGRGGTTLSAHGFRFGPSTEIWCSEGCGFFGAERFQKVAVEHERGG